MPIASARCCSYRLLRSTVCLLVVLWSVLVLCRWSAAQQPEPVPAAEPAATQGEPLDYLEDKDYNADLEKSRMTINRILRRGTFEGDDRDLFDQYYKNYALPRWTLAQNRAELEDFRKRLRTNLDQSKSGPVHDHLSGLVLEYMSRLAAGNYRPAARFNAVLMIGELNAVEAPRPLDAPTPLPGALSILSETLKVEERPDAVKVAALVGILRHAKLGGIKTPEDRKTVSDQMLALVTSKSPSGQAAVGHTWMRKQAAEVLGELGAVGENGKVARALAGVVGETGLPLRTRSAAAEALGRLDYQDAEGLGGSQLAVPLGQLAADACEAEAKAQKEAKARDRLAAEGQFRRQAPLESKIEIPTVSRRRLKSHLIAASWGLNGRDQQRKGVASLATEPPHKEFVANLGQHLKTMLDSIEATKEDDEVALENMMAKIVSEAEKLRDLLSKNKSGDLAAE